MVALSVSTSATKSPELTLSPTFLCHLAITPSVIVSLILGMRTTSAMFYKIFRYNVLSRGYMDNHFEYKRHYIILTHPDMEILRRI